MNKADSDRLESALIQLGLKPVPTPSDADVIVLNSCVVRQSAEDKAVGMLTATVLAIFFIPLFYVAVRKLSGVPLDGKKKGKE